MSSLFDIHFRNLPLSEDTAHDCGRGRMGRTRPLGRPAGPRIARDGRCRMTGLVNTRATAGCGSRESRRSDPAITPERMSVERIESLGGQHRFLGKDPFGLSRELVPLLQLLPLLLLLLQFLATFFELVASALSCQTSLLPPYTIRSGSAAAERTRPDLPHYRRTMGSARTRATT
jgi:hypothetical protein